MTDIVSTRVIDARPEAVFQAFVDPDPLARWWGPEGFTNTFHEFDPRPGGAWTYVMHGPDGTDYELANEFVELVPGERIVIQHLQKGHRFRLTITLADEAGGTRIEWRMRFESEAEGDRVRSQVAVANEQNLDRLQALLVEG